MAENVNVSGPVSIESHSKERVAYDLMMRVANSESGNKDRTYWLTLYTQCYKATSGNSLASVLKQD